MKKYILSFLIETESDTDYRTIATFDDLKTAQKEFKKEVKTTYRGGTDYACKGYKTEVIVLDLYKGEDIDSLDFEENLMQEVIYSEGIIDRMNWKGEHAVNYYFYAVFNGKELMYTMYYQDKKEMWGKKHKVPQSKLKEWYFR